MRSPFPSLALIGLSVCPLHAAEEDRAGSARKAYRIDTTGTTRELKTGASGTLRLHVIPADGYKVSPEAPLKIRLYSDRLTVAKATLGHEDADDRASTSPAFKVTFDAPKSGRGEIQAEVMFFLCSEKLCERMTEKLAEAIDVKP